jgi:RimJ/RimL family protein N-acetyltransferase
VSAPLAHEILAGNLDRVCPAEGWPHADTAAGISHVLAESAAEVWLIQVAGRTIGDCGTHGAADATGAIEIGYGLSESYRGRGYGTEAVIALTRLLVGRPEVTKVFARTAPDNVASWKVLEKAGFRRVSSSRTELRYECLTGPAR